ncbi:unnamed protein product, partial [Rotaria sp. Silwood2]
MVVPDALRHATAI